jgi:regulatory subunit for Cdc7p protein kinase
MATLSRRPLAPRPLHLHIPAVLPQLKTTRTSSVSVKRARSPDIGDNNAIQATPPKRVKPAQPSPVQVANLAHDTKDREARKVEREAQKAEFRLKYTRAFPTWVFHFDLDVLDPESAAVRKTLENKVSLLGAVCFAVVIWNEVLE